MQMRRFLYILIGVAAFASSSAYGQKVAGGVPGVSVDNLRMSRSGDMVTVRFTEVNLSNQLTVSNIAASHPDVFRYQVSGSTKTGIFVSDELGDAFMVSLYSSTAVPSGWLLPLDYVRSGSRVRLIVPHKLGQSDATYYVYPCYYEIDYGIATR